MWTVRLHQWDVAPTCRSRSGTNTTNVTRESAAVAFRWHSSKSTSCLHECQLEWLGLQGFRRVSSLTLLSPNYCQFVISTVSLGPFSEENKDGAACVIRWRKCVNDVGKLWNYSTRLRVSILITVLLFQEKFSQRLIYEEASKIKACCWPSNAAQSYDSMKSLTPTYGFFTS